MYTLKLLVEYHIYNAYPYPCTTFALFISDIQCVCRNITPAKEQYLADNASGALQFITNANRVITTDKEAKHLQKFRELFY